MRPRQCTPTAAEVHRLFTELLLPVLGPWPAVRSCTAAAVVAVLAYAAARLTSITDARARLAAAPDADTVLGHLARRLPDPDVLDRRVRAARAATLPRAVRRGAARAAVDTTLIPYHGRPLGNPDEVFRSQPKAGATHVHAYATAHLVRHGHRFTPALAWVRGGTTPAEVVAARRRRVAALGLKPRLLLLDRGSNNAGVVRHLRAARQPFVMPRAVHGRAPRDGRPTGRRAIRATHPTGWATYSWTPAGRRRVTVDPCVVRRRRADREGHRAFPYACWGVRSAPAAVYRVYRTRFGIETSYRQLHQARIRTTTRNPALRLLSVAVAVLLRNLWVWVHRAALASPRRGGRVVRRDRPRFRTMVLWLLHVAETRFRYADRATAEAPRREEVGPTRPEPR